MDLLPWVSVAIGDAQMLQGTGRYHINADVTNGHFQMLQRRTASEIKKGVT
jgi:hypothetical protein